MRNLDNDPHSRLNKVANILLTYGWRLASSGAETRVIMQALYEMAKALDAFLSRDHPIINHAHDQNLC
ncbi:MAG: hypothetical protein GX278_07315 [Aeromonadales bacterium]|nr:hypothetical protein [Aeromonadales bacterium]